MPAARRLILASQSPRRAQLLREAGFDFEQMVPPYADPDQPDPHHDPASFVAELALCKARSLRDALPAGDGAVILSADTVCVDDAGNLLGKPLDRADAGRMLRLLAGGRQCVLTGVAVLDGGGVRANFSDEAVVHCGPVTEAQMEAALEGGGWQGKAGGYNLFDLQKAGWPLTVEGDEATVMGLPMQRLRQLFQSTAGNFHI